MQAIIFQKGGLSDLTLERARIFPINRIQNINQELYLTESMAPKVVNYGGSSKIIEVVLEGLSKDNYDGTVNGLKTWFENSSINWSENNFTMLDEYGESFTVRYWQNNFNMPEIKGDQYSISFQLLVEA